MSQLAYQLAAFGAYTLCMILVTGQSFAWKETVQSFYVGSYRSGWLRSTGTFCATWMSPLSLIGYSIWFYHAGYIAFFASVNGWMLGLLFFPFIVRRLRVKRACSLPEWLEKTYGDVRVRRLVAAAMIFLYIIYLVIQFRAFGIMVSYTLKIQAGFAATSLIYLFVLYTTFGGYDSVSKSDTVNLVLIVAGVTVAAYCSLPGGFSFSEAASLFTVKNQPILQHNYSAAELFSAGAVMICWGLGVAGNPQYAIRIMACRRKNDAYKMLAISPVIIGWIYFCTTFFVMACSANYFNIGKLEETVAFVKLGHFLPDMACAVLFVGVIAAAVSTANSQLLLAACSLSYDLFPSQKNKRGSVPDFAGEDRFMLKNRLSIVAVATVSLVLSNAHLPGYMLLGRISWTLVAVCFFYPFFVPCIISGKILFHVLSAALAIQILLVFAAGVRPEYAMIAVLILEGLAFAACRARRRRGGNGGEGPL